MEPTGHILYHPNTFFETIIKVQTITLNDWVKQNNISKVDFLWLDMQGFELQMMKTSENIISQTKVILTEVSLKETYKNAPKFDDLKKWLESLGFEIKIDAIPQNYDMGNVLFVKK